MRMNGLASASAHGLGQEAETVEELLPLAFI